MRRNLYCKFLEYFSQAFPKLEGTLLDIGCGNGLLSCFYALRYPQVKVIGIDKAESAVSCSRQLAQRIGLANAEFVIADCDHYPWTLPESSIDIAVSMTGLDPSKPLHAEQKIYWRGQMMPELTCK
jgi:precorrin-6B methylase 2